MPEQEKESLDGIHSVLAVLDGSTELYDIFTHLARNHAFIPAAGAFRLTFCKELRDGFSSIF